MPDKWKEYLVDNFAKLYKIEDFGTLYEQFIAELSDILPIRKYKYAFHKQ
jgi:hypothetical protein